MQPFATAGASSMPGPGDKLYLAGGVGNDKVYELEIRGDKPIAELASDILHWNLGIEMVGTGQLSLYH